MEAKQAIEMTEAERAIACVEEEVRQYGGYSYRSARFFAVSFGGIEVWNSNEGERDISFAPDRRYAMPDGSYVIVSYSTAYVE